MKADALVPGLKSPAGPVSRPCRPVSQGMTILPLPRVLRWVTAFLILLGAAGRSTDFAAAGPSVVEARVEGTRLEVSLADGRTLSGADLVGAVLTIADAQGDTIQVRIDGAERDREDPRGGRWLYRLMTPTAGGGWTSFCEPGPKGRRLGFPVAGTTTADGSFDLSETQLSFTCTAGAVAKCIRFGYAPWASSEGGVPLLGYFRACLRMVRADYCGDGQPHTRDGTLINLYDRLGIQVSEPSAELTFEAAWGPEGAVCVRKTRIGAVWTLDALQASCGKRLVERLGPVCSPAAARSLPEALLFNESRDNP